MAVTKSTVPKSGNILSVSGLSSKSVTDINAYVHGSVVVIEVAYSGGTQYIKTKGLQIEVGGTNEWGSGTIQS